MKGASNFDKLCHQMPDEHISREAALQEMEDKT